MQERYITYIVHHTLNLIPFLIHRYYELAYFLCSAVVSMGSGGDGAKAVIQQRSAVDLHNQRDLNLRLEDLSRSVLRPSKPAGAPLAR